MSELKGRGLFWGLVEKWAINPQVRRLHREWEQARDDLSDARIKLQRQGETIKVLKRELVKAKFQDGVPAATRAR